VVIEVNPRLAGGMIPTLIELAIGVDLIDCTLARATGSPPELTPLRLVHTSIRFVVAMDSGTVQGVKGLEAARTGHGVRLAEFSVRPGARVSLSHSFLDRVGYVIATGPDAASAAARAQSALAEMSVEIAQGWQA
jgi:argininosuccinate lyase